jgi:sugar phosphate isomerase/epimerase
VDRLLSLASGVVPELTPVATAEAAGRGGWPAVGLWVEPPQWTAQTTRDVHAALHAHALTVLDVEVIWLKPGPRDPDHLRILDIGAEVGARNALVVSSDTDTASAIDKFARLCAHGREVGLRVALEFGFFTEVRSLAEAVAIVEAADHPAGAILIDPLHLERTGGTADDVAKLPREWLPYAQFCDAPMRGPGAGRNNVEEIIREALDDRVQCGDGALPQVEVLRALPDALPLSIELRSKFLRDTYPDAAERARVTLDATRRFLARAARAGVA